MSKRPELNLAVALVVAGVVALAGAATIGAVITLFATAVLATVAAVVAGVQLVRLALTIHRSQHSFGPCRGAGFLGVAALLTGVGTAVAGGTSVGVGAGLAALVSLGTTAVAAPAFLLGLLLLPGAAPTLGVRLRRFLDGLGIGIALLYTGYLLLPGDSGPTDDGAALAALAVGCLAIAVALMTGLRAARHRPSAQLCAAGTCLVMAGRCAFTVQLSQGESALWFGLAGAAMIVGPALVVMGARRSDVLPGPVETGSPGLAGYPQLVVPLVGAVAATAFHLIARGGFDAPAVVLGIAGVCAVALREALAARDLRRYTGKLLHQEALFRTLVSGSSDVTMVLDRDLVVRWQSPAAARQFSLSDQDVLGRPLLELLHPDDAGRMSEAFSGVLGGAQSGLVRGRLRDGFGHWRETESTVTDQRASVEVDGLVVHIRDVSERARLERTLDEVTWTDDLTGLPNRRKLLAAVAEALGSAAPHGAVLAVELDRFASVVDLHGPTVGDAVLIEAARRLQTSAPLVARISTDGFAVLTDVPLAGAFSLATRLATVLAEPYHLPGHTVHLAADVGVADLVGGNSADEVVRHADLARRRARQLGRGRVECYDASFEAALIRRTAIEQELPGIVGRGELDLAFQPILDLLYRQPAGAEALLRWRHPRLGPVPPMEFLPVAEELDMVDELAVWVLHRACRQLSDWRRDGRDLWMSVNMSPRQLCGDGFLAAVATALDTHCVPADSLIVEVALPAESTAVDHLAGLRALGVRTAVDHFGTGPTALAHLRRLPVDILKIDRVLFGEPAGQTGPATPIVDVVVALAQRLGIEVIAAGLETESHVDVVRAAGCHLGQGFLLSRPDHAEHIEAFFETHRARLF
jgi:diguanylate cyclase (GGDEF)-like protein/PAS domain S-box-containing protein